MIPSLWFLIAFAATLAKGQDSADAEVAAIFNPNLYDGFQRKYTVEVGPKLEECFFLENLQLRQVLNFHFMVVNVGKNGQKLDVTSRIKGPDGKVVNHQYKKNEAKYIGHEIVIPGDYEICLNNRFSMFETKKVFWQVEVEGSPDEMKEMEIEVNATVAEFHEKAQVVRKAVSKVRTKVSRMRHQQWRVEQNMKRDVARAEAVQDMVDRWSVIHACLIVAIGIVQAVILKRLFNLKPSSHGINMRT